MFRFEVVDIMEGFFLMKKYKTILCRKITSFNSFLSKKVPHKFLCSLLFVLNIFIDFLYILNGTNFKENKKKLR